MSEDELEGERGTEEGSISRRLARKNVRRNRWGQRMGSRDSSDDELNGRRSPEDEQNVAAVWNNHELGVAVDAEAIRRMKEKQAVQQEMQEQEQGASMGDGDVDAGKLTAAEKMMKHRMGQKQEHERAEEKNLNEGAPGGDGETPASTA